jgi:Cu2+-exporting ATPase
MNTALANTVEAADVETAEALCYHCGLPVPPASNWSVTIEQIGRAMCCPGCQAVAQTIVDIGQSSYYHTRSQLAATAELATLIPPELALYDNADPQFQLNDDSCEATLSIEGIRCAACVWLIEKRLSHLPGLQAVNLNVATERLYVRWDKTLCQPGTILQAVREVGYAAYPFDAARHGQQLQRASKKLGRQLFVAGLSMMQVMMYAAPAYLAHDGTLDASMEGLMRWASLLLTLPAICYSAQPFFQGALASLRSRMLGMDVPVALGIVAAFGASTVATWRGQGDVYFDSTTMFIFLLLASRYLELLARRKAAFALERLQHALPASASRLLDYPASHACAIVAASALVEGDAILVKPGEAIAADGVIVDGATSIDMALLTGESAPVPKQAGDAVPGGAINAGAAIVLRVSRPARDSTLSDLVKLIERAGQSKPRIAQWADLVASKFVACLLLFALASFAFWSWYDPTRAWPIAIAVLVVSCPCALSLATPSALAAAMDRLLARGVLIVLPHVLETLHRATHIVFDKTGTLTLGKPALRRIDVLATQPRAACLQIAAALEAASAHPLGRAIIKAAQDEAEADAAAGTHTEPAPRAIGVQELPGQGLEGLVHGRRYRLGSAAFVADIAGEPGPEHNMLDGGVDGMTPIWLGSDGAWLARLLLADALRDDAAGVIDHFRNTGKTLVLLSGDHQGVTNKIALELGIATARGECLPDQKLAYVQQLQQAGAIVVMVGDGINDAAVLRAADVSFAMGSGAALAQAHADTVLLSGRLGSVAETARMASKTMAVIRQNLAWATLYNLIAIPAAALGYLNPWLSGVGMALSSAVVIANALRLRRG